MQPASQDTFYSTFAEVFFRVFFESIVSIYGLSDLCGQHANSFTAAQYI